MHVEVVVFLALLCCCVVVSNDVSKPGFFLTLPPYLVYGREENVCLSLHNITVPVKATIGLGIKDWYYITERNINEEISCFKLHVPQLDEAESLPVTVETRIQHNKTILRANNSDAIMITFPNRSAIFIQTDKPIYTPNDILKFRILVLNEDLLPGKEKISLIRIKNSNGITIFAWNDVQTEHGLVQLDYELPDDAADGKWQIEADGVQKNFEIRQDAPRFKVYLKHPIIVYGNNNDSFTIEVCAQYLYSQPVRGKANLSLVMLRESNENISFVFRRAPNIISKTAKLENGCARFEILVKDINRSTFTIKGVVRETETGLSEEANSKCNRTYSPIIIEDDGEREYFRPGMPNFFELKLKYVKNASEGVILNVCYTVSTWLEYEPIPCSEIKVAGEETISFTLPPLLEYIEQIGLHISMEPFSLVYTKTLDMAYSGTGNYLYLTRKTNAFPKCTDTQTFTVYYSVNEHNLQENLTFYYVIKSNSRVIQIGTAIGHPKEAQTIPVESLGNVLAKNNSYTKYDTKIANLTISFQVNSKIVWRYQILVYYFLPNGNIVADNRNVELKPCLPNKVSASWLHEQINLNGKATLNVETSPNSLCSTTALDEASQSGRVNGFTAFKLLKQLTTEYKYDSLYFLPSCKDKNNRKKRWVHGGSGLSYDLDTIRVLKDFGVSIVTNYRIEVECWMRMYTEDGTSRIVRFELPQSTTYHYNPHAYYGFAKSTLIESTQRGFREEPTNEPLSSHLSETWLWDLIPTSADGTARFDTNVPSVVTNWTANVLCISPTEGVGITNSNRLSVTERFFVDAILPYSVTRGQAFRVNVKIFNYLNEKASAEVYLVAQQFVELLDGNLDQQKCIESGNVGDVSFRAKATELGKLNITIIANVKPSETCQSASTMAHTDVIVRTLLVVPEGFPVEATKSALICSNDTQEIIWNLEFPHSSYIPGSVKSTMLLNSDIFGTSLKNLDTLLHKPLGFGEGIIVRTAANLFTLEYASATNTYNDSIKAMAIENVQLGCQRLLEVIRKDGGFSQYPSTDRQGSMFLTAFLLETLSKAKPYCSTINDTTLEKITAWIVANQSQDGCFPHLQYSYYHPGKEAPIHSQNSTLTSFVLVSLVEAGANIPQSVLERAVSCITNQKIDEAYALSFSSLALILSHSRSEAVNRLNQLMPLLFKDETEQQKYSTLTVETYGYTLSALLHLNTGESIAQAVNIVHWLTQKLIPKFQFESGLQLTSALRALIKHARVLGTKQNLNVTVQTDEQQVEFSISEQSNLKLTTVKLKGTEDTVRIGVSGRGCVVAQSVLKYNVYSAANNTAGKGSASAKKF